MNKEILFLVKSISDKELLSQEKIFEALESALSITAKHKYFYSIDIRVIINQKNGNFNIFRRWIVVSKITQFDRQIPFKQAKNKKKKIKLNDFIKDEVTSITLQNINNQEAKKIIFEKVHESKKIILLDEFYNQKGQIITGTVISIKKKYIILSVRSHVEAIIDKSDMLPTENFQINEKIKGVLCSVHFMMNCVRLFLSRSNSDMLMALFTLEIPEIKDGLIKVQSISRDPGYHSKIAVESSDNSIDPIGACIGIRGDRIRSISNELKNERIDIILWNNSIPKFIINIFTPSDIHDFLIHNSNCIVDIFVDSENISQLIGKNGQNVRLASQLIGWSLNVVNIINTTQESAFHFHNIFIKYFNFDRNILSILIQFGLPSLKDLIRISYSDLLLIPGINNKQALFIKKKIDNIFSNILNNKEYCYLIN